ncbi:phosphohistidine phosphatase SixA [Leptolyngbyaceae cyanobacterium JSC-12]|nr:phosphohistidine phosphatase SixA [Leptolyngbyaceae cyanobacterium JSC-12]
MKWAIAVGCSTIFLLIGFVGLRQNITGYAASDDSSWQVLQQEQQGMVVIMRHAEAPGTGDPPDFQLSDCSTQRNLSAAGRSQAIRIGQAFRQRNIQIARVLSSQWCRCLDTARLLNLTPVEPFALLNSFFQNQRIERQQTRALQQFIFDQWKTQGVIILVTHQVNITALTNIFPQSGEMVVLQVLPNNQTRVVGQIRI